MLNKANETSERLLPLLNSAQSYRNTGICNETVSLIAALHSSPDFIRDEQELIPEMRFSFSSSSNVFNSSTGFFSLLPVTQPTRNDKEKTNNMLYPVELADALEYRVDAKVLQYSPSVEKERNNHGEQRSDFLQIAGPLLSSTPSRDLMTILARGVVPSESRLNNSKKPQSIAANSILQAPGLRNDFYSNLISWSPRTNKISVGLGEKIYSWGVDNDVELVDYGAFDIITALSHSNHKYFLIGTSNGKIILMDQERNVNLSSYIDREACIYCLTWFPDSKMFLAGNEYGEVMIFEIKKRTRGPVLNLRKAFKCHQQQICGITLDNSGTQIAVGGNDNSCSIWDITRIDFPTLSFILPHNAAVKAIAFCPWTSSLLVTGGGSRDRSIRFWHTKSGTLLSSHQTNAQITSLLWSKFKRQLVATFGFDDGSKKSLVTVFSYPSMCPISEVTASHHLRALSAVISPDGSALCVATTDCTLRVYKVWENSYHLKVSDESKGVYGSPIIGLCEDLDNISENIR